MVEQQPRVAMDLEANSLYAYRERICLVQVSIPGRDFIVDPLAGFALDGLGELLANPAIEKVFHASEYDLILFKREHGWEVCHLFDTMWAARILGYSNMGLAWFLQEFYGVTLSKKHQKANWAQRPLEDALLEYARMDTHYLLPLRDRLAEKLEEEGRMQEAREIFGTECKVRVPERSFDPEGYWSLPGAQHMRPRTLAILRELYHLREQEAKRRDQPVFKVLSNQTLSDLAQHAPHNLADLQKISGITARVADRLGPRLLRAIERGRKAPLPQRPARRPRRDPKVVDRYERLWQWRKAEAQARRVESDVILRRDALWEIAAAKPESLDDLARVALLGPVRLGLYGASILAQIA